jgi:RNA polymerase sigma-70 factor, ECF subfamily
MMTESEAIKRAKVKDLAGLQALVELYQRESIRLVFLIVRERQLAEDIVSDSFLTAYDRIQQFDENRHFGPWFRRILINNALKRVNRRKRFLSLDAYIRQEPIGTTISEHFASSSDLSEVMEETDMKTAIRDAVRSLSPKQRAVIVLRYYFDLSEAEIAEVLGIPRGTVKSRAAAGIGQLAGLLSGLRSFLLNLL